MVEEKNRAVLEGILALTNTACEASLELLERYVNGEREVALVLLNDLRSVVQAV